ncbi:DUF1801 domain-containing protein [Rathayibacter sp. ZW T2_19]|uniref:DUF1801 domain-containing protein n=1 Tax=Rathayibacter rubneri TaxID=2950106 RepID=A0A9X2E0E7_9MICO|nr:DUF1801 domain-containing protein [Rathayibacter rubneri]MCM6762226.1 DUF1801 domain-containing protein [Rathayibacter rubneri]
MGDDTGFSAQERAAMKARAAELRAEARAGKAAEKAEAERVAQDEKIAEMPEPDRALALRLHALVTEAAPILRPKLYYGQPGWAKDGRIIVFFRSGLVDKARYSTVGFSVDAALDDEGGLWPTSYALDHLDHAGAALLAERVAQAAR